MSLYKDSRRILIVILSDSRHRVRLPDRNSYSEGPGGLNSRITGRTVTHLFGEVLNSGQSDALLLAHCC